MKNDACIVCGKTVAIISGSKRYCSFHYVENEPWQCLFEDLRLIAQGFKVGNSDKHRKEIINELKKRHPEVVKKAQEEFRFKF